MPDAGQDTDGKPSISAMRRSFTGWASYTIIAFCILAALSHIYWLGIHSPGVLNLRAAHLTIGLVLIPLFYAGWKGQAHRVHWFDYLLILGGLASTAYVIIQGPQMIFRYGVRPTEWDLFFGIIIMAIVLELTRRAVGWALVSIVLVLLAYALFGSHAPGILVNRSFSWERTISFLFSMDGLYGIPLGVSSTYIYLFVLFGAMLQHSRAGDFYMDLAYSVAGRARGGPGKVSIFASALMGTVSGTGIGNVVTTGALTIPLMKRTGFRPVFAGAVEAVASTGGQIMPPIMGAGAFLMAEFVRVPYGDIVLAAIFPAMLYFLSVYIIVDLEAARLGLRGMPAHQLPKARIVLKAWGHLLIPIFVLVWMLAVENVSPVRAALFSMAALLIVSWIRVESRLSPKRLADTALQGTRGSLEVIISCAAAGLIMGLLSLTGTGLRLSAWVADISGGSMILALVLTMIVTIILSMGLPTTAAYIVSASVLAPALNDLGVELLPAHLFIFYFACLSGITPPVALVAIPAGSIAGANPFAVGVKAFQLALAGFIIPYMIVYSPELILHGSKMNIAISVISAVIGVWALAVAVIGFLLSRQVGWVMRTLFSVSALALIAPGWVTDLVGIGVIALLILLHRVVGVPKHGPDASVDSATNEPI
ncbi:TRAP transporter permease [Sulfitobacter sp. AS92]|uniref:TRAP transporter permease n=1 Tax=Sulfitobacter sp. AS92 TaxID=3135783 RepID=UPI0031782CB4